jgi:hypothetical protein
MMTISGCTSIQTYGLDQINSDLPIDVGDKVRVFINNNQFSEFHITVSAITDESIKGALVSDPAIEVTLLWDEIARMELRQPDASKTKALTVIGIVLFLGLLLAVKDIAESFDSLGSNTN